MTKVVLSEPPLMTVGDNARSMLFNPFSSRDMILGNRIVMAPMTRWHSPNGIPGPDVAEYYTRRAAAGVGLIITEGTFVDHPGANGYDDVPAFFGEGAVAGWKRVVDAVHDAGGKIAPQLWHVGAIRRKGVGPDPSVGGYGPMAMLDEGVEVVRAATKVDLADIVDSFARAAAQAASIGFDAVEIHGAHGYLLDQFLWAHTNRRTDAYGGSLENRARLACEVCAAVRESLPSSMPLIFRYSQWKMDDYNARLVDTSDELAALLLLLRDAGVDIFHVSTRRFAEPAFAGSEKSLARWTKEITGCPVIAVGSVGLDTAHRSRAQGGHQEARAGVADLQPVYAGLAAQDFDLIAVGRGLLADPAWAAKVRLGQENTITALQPHHLKVLT